MDHPNGDRSVETLKTLLSSATPPSGDGLRTTLERLLTHALEGRDPDSVRLVARYMDSDPALDEALNARLNDDLVHQPDAVYFFFRTRLADGVDERWLPRLHAAAICALQVAVDASDTETLWNWLKLISREPATYQLNDLLRAGILAARPRTHDNGDFGAQLVALAARRTPDALEELLADAELVAALSDPLGAALRDHNPEAVDALQSQGREVYLVALTEAARARAEAVFTPATITTLWQLYTGNSLNLPERYHPDSILRDWVEQGVEWLSSAALEQLLSVVLADKRDDLFYQLAHHLSEHQTLFPMLATVLQASGRSVTDILGLIGQGVAAGDITPQQAVNTYIALLVAHNWDKEALPLVEQLARMIQQGTTLVITSEVSWRMLDMAAETRLELVARSATRRLLTYLESLPDEAELIDQLLRLYSEVQWSSAVRQKVLEWWREFIRSQALTNLQRYDKALEGKRPLEEARGIVQTAIAVRKLLGKRTLVEFASEVNATFALLQALADAFDPSPKQPAAGFDPDMVRTELAGHQEELNAQERKLLAKNLKELAQVIMSIAENRSKGSLIRRDDELDRQLITGAETPHSAMDTLKWLSGYLDGAQDVPTEGE